MKRHVFSILFQFMTLTATVFAQDAGPGSDAETVAKSIWGTRKSYFIEFAKGGTRKHRTCYYDLQRFLTPVLEIAVKDANHQIMDDLVEIVEATYGNLQTFDEIRSAVRIGSAASTPAVMDPDLSGAGSNVRTWFVQTLKPDKSIHYDEVILYNAQYLFFICRLARQLATIPVDERSDGMKRFLRVSSSIVTSDQLIRLIYKARYESWIELPEVTGYRAVELKLRKEIKRRDGKRGPAYDNAVIDTEMWLIAAASEWLAASGIDAKAVPLGTTERDQLKSYVRLGANLLHSRLTDTNLKDFKGNSVKGAGFDHGIWAEHPDFVYAGYRGEAFPKEQDKQTTPVPADVGWDISHAGRFPLVFVALYETRQHTGSNFPSRETLEKLANQFAYAVFNGDFRKPLFRNFMNGSNGWYRVNYSGRMNSGYGPFMASEAVLDGSWALLGPYNSDVQEIQDAIWRVLRSDDENDVRHRETFYRSACENLNQYAFFARLQFSSAYAAMKRESEP